VLIRPNDPTLAVHVCLEPVDFRKQAASLAALVQVTLEHDPFSSAIYCFTNRRRNAVKLLVWERNGHVLWHKRLERDRFHWPRISAGAPTVQLSVQELNWLLDGLDLRHWQPHGALDYQYAA
jgi:transposase